MYKVTKRQPTRIISEEYYGNKLLAMIRRDMINATCKDEYTGAIIEPIVVSDLITSNLKEIEVDGCTSDAYSLDQLEITIEQNTLQFKAENTGNIQKAESEWACFDFSFYDYETETEYHEIKMNQDTLTELNHIISENQREDVQEHAYQEWMDRA